ncbi:MAG: hypothetical protein MJB57_07610 [Gemmatimonadetes bacterium]|nr:hypothetical protein [Gemmatimonadota bacterium]
MRGDRIDTNGGTYWSLPDEREPRSVRSYVAQSISLTALQRSRGIINSDAYDSLLAKGLREHPGHPLLMRLGAVHDVWFITTEEARDSARAFHLEHLEAYASHQPRTVEELGALTNYATALVDDFWADPTVERLRRELERVAPDHPEVSRLRLVSTWMSVEGDRQSLAGFFEEEWDRLSPGYVGDLPELANIALEGSADLALRRRWAERRFLLRRATRDGWLLQDVRDPGLRDWAMRHIPDRIRFWEQPDDSLRPLHQTREDYEKSSRRLAARLMIGLGYGHVARRELDEAIALLEPALNIHWDLSAAEALLENAGEVGYDLPRIRALVEADPLSTLSARMELSDPNARAELLRLLKAQVPTTRAAPSRIRVRQAIDVDVSLNTGTTLIAYWYSPPVDEASLSYLERLRDAGVATWLLSREQNYEVTRGIADRVGGEAAFQVDSYGREVFGIRRIEAYVVVHGGRFWTTFRAEEAVRLALLLTDGERP